VSLKKVIRHFYIDHDTVADEEFETFYNLSTGGKKSSWPLEGPNVNIKLPKRSYSSKEEKRYFYNKIKTKQKTEVLLLIYLVV
jgi:hypothetical protein